MSENNMLRQPLNIQAIVNKAYWVKLVIEESLFANVWHDFIPVNRKAEMSMARIYIITHREATQR